MKIKFLFLGTGGCRLLTIALVLLCHGITQANDKSFPEIVKNEDLLKFSRNSFQLTVTGLVTDPSGAPLPGATIIEKGTTNGSSFSEDNRLFPIPQSEAVLNPNLAN